MKLPVRSMCVALFLSALALVRAATPEEALAAEKAGDLAKALRLFTELAEAGDAAAAIDVGRFYFDGTGVARDYGKAMTWWVRAFEAGHGMAYNNIAVLYRDGLGVPKNLQIAWGLLYIGHMRGLGPQDAVSRMNRNMEKLVPQLTPEDVHEACRWSEEYFKAYVKNRGQNLAAIEELKLSRNHPPVLVLATF